MRVVRQIKPRQSFKTVMNFSGVRRILFLLLFLSQIETFAQSQCSDLFESAQNAPIVKTGTQVLLGRDPNLHLLSSVEKTSEINKRKTGVLVQKPADKVEKWLASLEKIAAKGDRSPLVLNQLKTILHKQFVQKTSDVPESYYQLQVKIARERGHGDIQLTEQHKRQMAETVIQDLEKSMDLWTEYLVSKDTQMYPMWLKYWMFTGMVKLSKYDATTGSFGKRSKETVAPYPEMNREALAYVADAVLRKLNKESLDDIADPAIVSLLEGMNFGKLYGKTLFNMGVGLNGRFRTNAGRWVVYPKRSDHLPLVKSLEGKNTGWCTAGASTAATQIRDGDFHVYYSFDEKGQATVPRVAIRMENEKIAEVRGVDKNQNLDEQINHSDVVINKMKEFGAEAESFEKKDRDMKRLTVIEEKMTRHQELTVSELRFLYEMDGPIEGFGYQADPRIAKIKSERNFRADLIVSKGLKLKPEEISTTMEELLSGTSKYHVGDIYINLKPGETLKLPDIVEGAVRVDVESGRNLILPRVAKETNLASLRSLDGLKLPEVTGGLNLPRLESAEGLVMPEHVNGHLILGIKSTDGLVLPKRIDGMLSLENIKSADGLVVPEGATAVYMPHAVTAKGLIFPPVIKGTVNLKSLKSIEKVQLPQALEQGQLVLEGLTTVEGLHLPRTNGMVYLTGVTSITGLKIPEGSSPKLIYKK